MPNCKPTSSFDFKTKKLHNSIHKQCSKNEFDSCQNVESYKFHQAGIFGIHKTLNKKKNIKNQTRQINLNIIK